MITEVLIFLTTILLAAYVWAKDNNNYWKRHNVKYVQPLPFLGNLMDIFTLKSSLVMEMYKLYNTPGFENEPVIGIYAFHKPALLVRDLDLIKNIMIKDFKHFDNRVIKADPHHDPLGAYNLFVVNNTMWSELRRKISPIFSSGKIKKMYPLMQEIGHTFEELLKTFGDSQDDVDIKDITSRFTSDCIGTTAFGIHPDSLHNEKSEFYITSRDVIEPTAERCIAIGLAFFLPSLSRLFRMFLFPAHTAKFIRKCVADVMTERTKSGIKRNDLIDILLALQREGEANVTNRTINSLPLNDTDFLTAQAATFQFGGQETSSSTTTFALYELALAPESQDKLRAEICQAFEEGNGMISYERIQELEYLGMVIHETLRKYPIAAFLDRECTTDVVAGYSMRPYLDFAVPAGMPIYVTSLGIQRDAKYWPNPDKWDPERFAPANRDSLNMNAYMPFGIGPRKCIGIRIGVLQTKLALAHFLRNHRVAKSSRTAKIVEFDPRTTPLTLRGGTYLRVERVN